MDIIVQFWDNKTNNVTHKYLSFKFLGHATAADLLVHFKIGAASLNPNLLLQNYTEIATEPYK